MGRRERVVGYEDREKEIGERERARARERESE